MKRYKTRWRYSGILLLLAIPTFVILSERSIDDLDTEEVDHKVLIDSITALYTDDPVKQQQRISELQQNRNIIKKHMNGSEKREQKSIFSELLLSRAMVVGGIAVVSVACLFCIIKAIKTDEKEGNRV